MLNTKCYFLFKSTYGKNVQVSYHLNKYFYNLLQKISILFKSLKHFINNIKKIVNSFKGRNLDYAPLIHDFEL